MSLKEKIIHESLKLFSLNGFLNTSILDIISAAQTSKGGFYNHFTSKEDLFYQVLDESRKIWREKNLAAGHMHNKMGLLFTALPQSVSSLKKAQLSSV